MARAAVLILLWAAVAAGCDRRESRLARQVLHEHVTPHLTAAGMELPIACRLHPKHDMYRDQEEHKKQLRVGNWRCDYCGKLFKAEEYLDKHMDNRHSNMTQGTVCLAEYVDLLHGHDFHDGLRSLRHQSVHNCTVSVMDKRAMHCQNMFSKCFPLELGDGAARLQDYFVTNLCGAHTCDLRRRRALLKSIVQKDRTGAGWGWTLLSGALLLCTVLIYIFLLLMKQAQGAFSNTADLQRRPGRPRHRQLGTLQGATRILRTFSGGKMKNF
mmetsp:Transcript_45375/g.116120  ORF Transcript_45375/g.116120 Transcript_45375/m.116120 type:complete len:270 (+) Transcript_45375:171-980(+)|eukprot:jgi/Tetstr1/466878/TSEL_011333.t1